MKELKRLIEVYDKIDFTQRKAALASVVKLYGSSYRRPGARMLITDDGRWEGAISGGCLEGDALRKARQVMSSGKPMVVTYDTMDDNNSSFGIGLGCNGIIDVLIEPVVPDTSSNPFYLFKNFAETTNREIAVLVTVAKTADATTVPLATRWLVQNDGSLIQHTGQALPTQLQQAINLALQGEKPAYGNFLLNNTEVEVFLEIMHPGIQLLVFGGGYDAIPLVNLAKDIGMRVIVTDDCIAHLAPLRFPKADTIKQVDRHQIPGNLPLTRHTAVVLISHNYKYDLAVLTQLLETDVPYIGILGPRKRTDKMLTEYEVAGKTFADQQLEKIYSPVGLDIGAETPEEIALSIVSEIQAFFTRKSGGNLKNKQGYIHDRAGEMDIVVSARDYTIGDTCAL
ncbi:XdhC family protein [Rhodocytophaga aerolata]|uniref:XdhC family protein n=1 Tax=Rhodocytophaga aerolata TaxID=455078 RepID=A0ABT8R9F8_9BACT|nr:XdhC/CoxI family protein [Rhodocytophaga aerolata]MDO1448727.1 XdhC family protein [Rhodocytophaga aerolata]